MSNFNCEKCGETLYDTPTGYIKGCEHYPRDRAPNQDESNFLQILSLQKEVNQLKAERDELRVVLKDIMGSVNLIEIECEWIMDACENKEPYPSPKIAQDILNLAKIYNKYRHLIED